MTTTARRAAPDPTPDSAAGPWIAVREAMSPPAATLPADAPLGVAVAEVLRTRTDRLWITGRGRELVGAISDAALTRAEIRGVPAATPAGDLMATVEPLAGGADAAAALGRLGEHGEPRVPVVENGELVGELTRADVLGLVHSVRRVAAIAGASREEIERKGPSGPRFLSRGRRSAVHAPVPAGRE